MFTFGVPECQFEGKVFSGPPDMASEYQHTNILQYYVILHIFDVLQLLQHLGSQEDDSVSPEEASFVEEEVKAELRGEGDQTEDEGEQEENTWTDQLL